MLENSSVAEDILKLTSDGGGVMRTFGVSAWYKMFLFAQNQENQTHFYYFLKIYFKFGQKR